MSAPEISSFYMWCASETVQTAGYWSVDPPTGGGNPSTRFIAFVPDIPKDPAVIAALPEAQTLVAAARAEVWEEAAKVDGWEAFVVDNTPAYLSDWQRGLVAGQQAFAAAIRARKEKP